MRTTLLHNTLLVGTLTATLLTGCTVGKFTNEDAPLMSVKFESMAAEQTFYNAILAKHFPAKDDSQKSSKGYAASIDLPLPLWVKNDSHKSYRVIVNEAITKADTNQDGTISESEAKAYAESVSAKKSDKSDKEKED